MSYPEHSLRVGHPSAEIQLVDSTESTDWTGYHSDFRGGARGVVVIVVGIGHGDTSSNPGRDIVFHIALIPLGKV